MGEQADRRDMLRLLAVVAAGLGAKGLDEYQPPSEALEEALAEPPAVPRRDRERRLQVLALSDLGEVG